jgi:transcriptional regulator with XRE-family HTH domain
MITLDIDQFYAEIGRTIKSARLKRGLTQDIMASHLNLTRSSIINLEKGRHRPSIFQLLQISDLLKISYKDLIPYNEPVYNEKVTLAAQREILSALDKAVTDQQLTDKPSRKAVFNFLTDQKK